MICGVMIEGIEHCALTLSEQRVLFVPLAYVETGRVPAACETARQVLVSRVRALGSAWGIQGVAQPQLRAAFERASGAPIFPEVVLTRGLVSWALQLQAEWARLQACVTGVRVEPPILVGGEPLLEPPPGGVITPSGGVLQTGRRVASRRISTGAVVGSVVAVGVAVGLIVATLRTKGR